MTSREIHLTRFALSKSAAGFMASLALVMALAGYVGALPIPIPGDRGLAFPSPNKWLEGSPGTAFGVNLLLMVLTAGLMARINNLYSILRSYSLTFVGLFLVATAATPTVCLAFEGGAILAPVILCAMTILFGVYNQPQASLSVFTAFLVVSVGTLFQYGFAVYLPILLLGCAQMRILNLRNILAALGGTVTPWWLWWAFFPEHTVTMPEFNFMLENIPAAYIAPFVTTVALTLLTGLITGVVNSVKIFAYNARARAFNGLLTVVSVLTVIMLFLDFTNLMFYITLLNVTVAFQVGHFLVIKADHRSYIVMLGLPVVYFVLFIWRMSI